MFEIDEKQKKSIELLKNHYGRESTKILIILKNEINLKRENGFHLIDLHLMLNIQFDMKICYGNFQRWLYRKNNKNKIKKVKDDITSNSENSNKNSEEYNVSVEEITDLLNSDVDDLFN